MAGSFPSWNPGTDTRNNIIFDLLQKRFAAEEAINKKAATLPWIGNVLTDLRFEGRGYHKEYQFATIFAVRQNETSPLEAFEVHGLIRDRYDTLDRSKSVLGLPLSDELVVADGNGRYSRFQNGVIYWSLATGAHEVYGEILAHWYRLGNTTSWLGYPLTGELPIAGGRMSSFENGQIIWTGAITTQGYRDEIIKEWNRMGGVFYGLGLPVDPDMPLIKSNGAFTIYFRAGYIDMVLTERYPRIRIQKLIRVRWTGLECQVRQEKNDELFGCVSVWSQPTKIKGSVEFPAEGPQPWKLGHEGERIMTTSKVLYEGPPAGLNIVVSLFESDEPDGKAAALADVVKYYHGDTAIGTLSELFDRVSEHGGRNLEGALQREWLPTARYQKILADELDTALTGVWRNTSNDVASYPTGLLILRWDQLEKQKQVLKRSDDAHNLTWTEAVRVEGRDAFGDIGVYVFYFDVEML